MICILYSQCLSLTDPSLFSPASFAKGFICLAKSLSPADSKVTSWANISVPFASAATVSKIGVGEIPWWRSMRFLTSVVCERASVGLREVWEIQGSASIEGGPGGVGRCLLLYSLGFLTTSPTSTIATLSEPRISLPNPLLQNPLRSSGVNHHSGGEP